MKFKIDHKIIGLFPQVKIALLVGKGLENRGCGQFAMLLRDEEEKIQKKCTLEELAKLPKISDWREAYRKFGFKPSSHRSSIEALLRRILQNKELPSINPIVDLYNLVSIKYMLPAGGDDLDNIEGGITLTIAEGTERFVMLGSDQPEEIKKGEVIYRDDKEVLCRSWNYRECEKSKITGHTKNVCLLLEGLEHSSKVEILQAAAELRNLLSEHCQGDFQEFFLDHSLLEVQF